MKTNAELVYLRNRLVDQLHDSIDMYHEGDTSHLVELLNRVAQADGWSVDVASIEPFFIRGRKYVNRSHVKIEGEEKFIVRIMKIDGKLQYELNHYMLMTNEELKAESDSEIEAERQMSAWACGYRPHLDYMDDPRGE